VQTAALLTLPITPAPTRPISVAGAAEVEALKFVIQAAWQSARVIPAPGH